MYANLFSAGSCAQWHKAVWIPRTFCCIAIWEVYSARKASVEHQISNAKLGYGRKAGDMYTRSQHGPKWTDTICDVKISLESGERAHNEGTECHLVWSGERTAHLFLEKDPNVGATVGVKGAVSSQLLTPVQKYIFASLTHLCLEVICSRWGASFGLTQWECDFEIKQRIWWIHPCIWSPW